MGSGRATAALDLQTLVPAAEHRGSRMVVVLEWGRQARRMQEEVRNEVA